MKNSIFSILVCTLFALYIHAQGENNNWYFRNGTGLSFNTSPASVASHPDNTNSYKDAIVSDHNGNVLFYVSSGEGIKSGVTHTVMPNGGVSNGGSLGMNQPSIIVAKPGSCTNYIVAYLTLDSTIRTLEVDMSLNGGNGDVLTANKGAVLMNFTYNVYSTTLTVARHANGIDYWILVHDDGARYKSFLVTSSGVNTTPVVSYGSLSGIGYPNVFLKINPQGTKAAYSYGRGSSDDWLMAYLEVTDFNNATGVFSNIKTRTFPLHPSGDGVKTHGTEFSANGNVLYFSTGREYLYQLNVNTLVTTATFTHSPDQHTPTDKAFGVIQRGQDNKIYIYSALLGSFYDSYACGLDVIHFPDVVGMGCGFSERAITLPITPGFYIPQWEFDNLKFPQLVLPHLTAPPPSGSNGSIALSPSASSYCSGTQIEFEANITGATPSTISWNFGDGSTSTQTKPKHTYNTAGTYTVTFTYSYLVNCATGATASKTVTTTINIQKPNVSISPSTATICIGSSVTLNASGADTYSWNNGLGSGATKTVSPTTTTTYTVTGTTANNCSKLP